MTNISFVSQFPNIYENPVYVKSYEKFLFIVSFEAFIDEGNKVECYVRRYS